MTRLDRTSRIVVRRSGYDLNAGIIRTQGQGRPWVVFGNSLVTDLTIWNAQAEALAGKYNVLRFDQMGHGASGVSPDMPDFGTLGADLLAVMDAAGVDRAIYVGLSMGVPTGLAAHAMQPGRFEALVFCDGQCRTAPGGSEAWADRIASARIDGMAAFARATADRWLTQATSEDLRQRLTTMIAATPFEGFRACATALMDYDYFDELARIRVPTLLVAGAQDGTMPQGMASVLKPNISGAQMVVIENAGHVPCFEQATAFNDALLGFLSSACAATGNPLPHPHPQTMK